MTTHLRIPLALVLFGLAAQACATGSSHPAGPVELDGTKWKLVMIGGALDGRVIEFKKKGKDGYIGTLAEPGKQLREVVGLEMGRQIFSVRKKGEKEYEGIYVAIDKAGNIAEREVVFFIDGNSLTWNQENAVWERME